MFDTCTEDDIGREKEMIVEQKYSGTLIVNSLMNKLPLFCELHLPPSLENVFFVTSKQSSDL